MTDDEKRDSLDKWRKRVKKLGIKVREAGEKTAQGFGSLAEKLGNAGS